jgi:hypothetical protein
VLVSPDDTLAAELLQSGEESGDRAWRLPLWDEYQSQLKRNFADMANIGGWAWICSPPSPKRAGLQNSGSSKSIVTPTVW